MERDHLLAFEIRRREQVKQTLKTKDNKLGVGQLVTLALVLTDSL